VDALRACYDAHALCGLLAHAAGLLERPERVRPDELLPAFAWERVAQGDRVLRWTGEALVLDAAPD
jgi:hypothetical protein